MPVDFKLPPELIGGDISSLQGTFAVDFYTYPYKLLV